MRFDFESPWLRIVIEWFPRSLTIQRYCYAGEGRAALEKRRLLRRVRQGFAPKDSRS